MFTIDLKPIPNQRAQFVADGQQYDIRVFAIDDLMYMDVSLNGTTVITSCQCLAGQQVVPYDYLEALGGNFIFNTASGSNPQYANFGGADILLYATNAELAGARA
jgi:hypothetical protein